MYGISTALLALASICQTPLNAQAAIPLEISGSATITMNSGAPDSTLKLGTRIVVTGWIAGRDTVRFQYLKNDTTVLTTRRTVFKDSTTVPAPAYNTGAKYTGCAIVERGGRNSGIVYPANKICWTWNYFREPPPGTVDSIFRLSAIIIRPLGPRLIADSGGTCTAWQASHPTQTPWIVVNSQAVPQCMHKDSLGTVRLSIWQFCVFAEDSAGHKVKTQNSWNIPYCEEEFKSWIAEVQS